MALTKVTGDFIKDGSITQGHLHASHGITTSDIGEGSNLYFTTARVDSRIGDLSTSDLSEGSNLYYTDARADARIAAASTSDLSEGTNLYYTDARVGSYLTTNSYATQSYVNTQVSNLVDSAPGTLDTLNELAAALGDDANFSTTVTNSIATKLPLAGGTLTGALSGTSATFSGIGQFAGAIKITETGTAQHILIGNQDSGGTNKPGMIRSANASLEFGYGNSWSGEGGTMTTSLTLHSNSNASFTGAVTITTSGSPGLQISKDRNTDNRFLRFNDTGTSGKAYDIINNGNLAFYNNTDNNYILQITSGGNATFTGTLTASGYNNSNWDTAYGWGNHASAGYLTSYTETDTLATVTARGNTTSAIITVNQVITTNNGSGTNYRVGDDAWIGDINVANTLRISGNQNANNGYITFGNSSNDALGRAGTGALTWAGNTIWHAGNDGSGSGLNADTLDGIDSASFVRSDADDTLSGQYTFTKTNDHAIKVGTIRGTAVGSQTGEFIQMYNRVNIGGPSGWGASNTATPSYGLSTYGGTRLAVYTDYTESGGSMRAPIFYDSNDTNYYLNPAGTSQIRKTNLVASGSGWDDGLNLYSSDGSNRWNLLVDDGAGDMFRIAYNNSEKLRLQTDGEVFTLGTGKAGSDFRAPVFYDSNNTGFYAHLDNSGGNTSINAAGVIRGNYFVGTNYAADGYTIYKGYDNWNHYIVVRGHTRPGQSKTQAAILGGHQTSFVEYAENNSTTGWFFIGSANSTYEEIAKITKDFASFTQVRAPIFYDSNNTNYYADLQSNTRLNGFVKIGNSSTYNSDDGNWGARLQVVSTIHARIDVGQDANAMRSSWYCHTGQSGSYFGATTGHDQYLVSHDTVRQYLYNGWSQEASSYRAPVFYDSNNTNFYTDPASISVMYRVKDDHGNEMYTRKHSGSDFVSGTLVQTDITSNTTNGASFVLEATGKSYSTEPPFSFMVQGYLYNNTIINYSGIHFAKPGFTTMKVLDYNGKLAFWWPRVSYWNSFDVHVRNAGGDTHNLVTGISNSTEPSSSKKVSVTMRASSIYGYNPGTSYATNAYAQVYYDTDNTTYKLDAASTSVFNTVHFGNNTNNGFVSGYGTYSLNISRLAQMSLDWNANYNQPSNHGIMSTDSAGNFADSVSINSFNDITLRLDSNNNNSVSALRVKDGTTGSGNDIFIINQAAQAQLGRSGMNPQLTLLYNDSGSGAGWDTGIYIGRSDDLPNGTSFPTYTPTGGYGIQFQANSDGVFYGMKEYSSGNYRPFINWGDDSSDSPMEWAFNGSTQMSLSYNGNLTIKDVLYMSHGGFIQTVSGGVMRTSFNFYAERFYDYYNSTYYVDVDSSSYINSLHTAGTLQVGASGTSNIYMGGTSGNYFRFHTHGGATYFDMNSGTINWRQGSSTRYYFYPSTANMTINGTLTQYSDIRYKENIVEIPDAIDKIKSIRGVYYNRTDFNTEPTKIGVIAQEVEVLMPELILQAEDTDLKSVSYNELTAVLVQAIKEQQTIIDDLKSRIETLENQ